MTLIVFEGPDGCGKTTQVDMLMEWFELTKANATRMSFPDRSTAIGQVLDEFLKIKHLNPHAVHLLFSANRWEKLDQLNHQASIVVCDRYCYSGTAYSMARGLDKAWCLKADEGLPEPTVVFYMDQCYKNREGKKNFDQKVAQAYFELMDKKWIIIDGSQSKENVHQQIVTIIKNIKN